MRETPRGCGVGGIVRDKVASLRAGASPERARLLFHASFTLIAHVHRIGRGTSARWVAALTP